MGKDGRDSTKPLQLTCNSLIGTSCQTPPEYTSAGKTISSMLVSCPIDCQYPGVSFTAAGGGLGYEDTSKVCAAAQNAGHIKNGMTK